MTRGIDCNNYLNLAFDPDALPWNGQVFPTKDSRGFLSTFTTVRYGVRAAVKQIWINRDKHGCDTIAKMIDRWAPPDTNDTGAYTSFIASKLGVGANIPVDFHNIQFLKTFIQAVAAYEQGCECLDDTTAEAAIVLALA